MSCGCDHDSDCTIDGLYFEETASSMPTVCEDCEAVIDKGGAVVLYHGSIGDCECEDWDNDECTCGNVEPWGMVSCPVCHRMRQDLQVMGYCISYPGLQRLLDNMEDDDLISSRDHRAFRDAKFQLAKRTMNKVSPYCGGMSNRYDPWGIHGYQFFPSWVRDRMKDAQDKAMRMASVWRCRAIDEPISA